MDDERRGDPRVERAIAEAARRAPAELTEAAADRYASAGRAVVVEGTIADRGAETRAGFGDAVRVTGYLASDTLPGDERTVIVAAALDKVVVH